MISNSEKLLINDYKNRFPHTSNEELSRIFEKKLSRIKYLFSLEYIIIPSKMNKDAKK